MLCLKIRINTGMIMPKFSQESFKKLSMCHIDLQVLFYEVIKYYDCKILESYRDAADQEKDFAAGKTKLHYPYSKHNHMPALAVDVAPYPIDFKDEKRNIWFGGYVCGLAQILKESGKMTHAIRWGGAWEGLGKLEAGKSLEDSDHFELLT